VGKYVARTPGETNSGNGQQQDHSAGDLQVLQLGQALSAQALSSALPPPAQRRGQNGAAEQQSHAFWGTQPVAQFGDDPTAWVSYPAFRAPPANIAHSHY
jgi:hypothetical protein